MSFWIFILLVLGRIWGGLANEVLLITNYQNQDEDFRQRCSGMYSRSVIGGKIDPYIEVILTDLSSSTNSVLSIVIFEWEDVDNIGVVRGDEIRYVCDNPSVLEELCTEAQLGEFLIGNTTGLVYTQAITLDSKGPIKYDISKTGYYCVGTVPLEDTSTYNGLVTWQNSYGQLAAAEYPRLPFYGLIAITYFIIGAIWAFLYIINKKDILPVQNYISAIIVFLLIEMCILWAYYDLVNIQGNTAATKALMGVTAVFNAGRNSFSLFLLLIVSLGYGVVKPTLGPIMRMCQILAGTHFAFGLVYALGSMSITPESTSLIVLFAVMPLSATMTVFYLWILTSLNNTIKQLEQQKQTTKAMMYKRLSRLLIWSIIVLIIFFTLNSLTFAQRMSPDFIPNHWRTRWFVLDGWLNILYLTVFVTIVFLWRPTANNRRFAMSQELAQDEDEEFEIGNLAHGGDEDSDDEDQPKPSSNIRTATSTRENAQSQAQAPNTSTARPEIRDDEEGEGLFSVGDEEDFESFGESDEEVNKKGKKQ